MKKLESKGLGLALALSIVALAGSTALERTALAAEPGQDEQAQPKKSKKKVRATLVEPAEPSPSAPAAETAPEAGGTEAERAEGEGTAEPAPREEAAPTGTATSTESPATSTESPAGGSAITTSTGDVPPFEERVEVVEVFLDAIVKDGKQLVTGLGPEDFVVKEEGREVEVTSARFYGATDQLSATGEGEVERADRYFILAFHDRARDAPILRSMLLDAGQQARRWVEEDLLPNDQVAVVMYDVRLKVYSDFTRDREQLATAISRAVSAKKEPERVAGRSKEPLRPAADSPSLLLNLPAGRDLARETRRFETAMALVGRATEGIAGRKNLILFSIGFGDVDSSGVWSPDTIYYPQLERNLNDGNVAVYAIDLVGARRLSAGSPGLASSLSSIASDTAGLYLENFTTFHTPLKQVVEDTPGYYLLSYRSEYDRGTSGYREVRVETRDKRYDVRARKGHLYGEANAPPRIRDRASDDEEGAGTGSR